MQLTALEISKAENLWIVETQKSLLEEPAFHSWKQQFRLFLDNGVWRCKGRLDNADVPYVSRHPALLPKNHHVISLIVWDCHNKVMHNGVKETLCELRSRYWIVKERQLMRRMLHQDTRSLWRRWKTEYLLELRESHRYGPKTDLRGSSLSEGDVVLMQNDSKLRGFWKLVKVHRLIKGHDSCVRGATVRVPTNDSKTIYFTEATLEVFVPFGVH